MTNLDAGNYNAEQILKVTATVTHALPVNMTITHHWERHSSSTVADIFTSSGGVNTIRPVEQVIFTNTPSINSATLEGYVYYLNNGTNAGWYPASPEAAELTYSLIGCYVTNTEEVVTNALQLYPNPATDDLNISIPDDLLPEDEIACYDFSGKLMFSSRVGAYHLEDNAVRINIAQLPQGMYTCVIRSKEMTYSAKFVKL